MPRSSPRRPTIPARPENKSMSQSRPAIPPDMKAFNRALIEEWRGHNGPLSGPMAGGNLIPLSTTGARAGRPRTIVLGYGRHDDETVASASNNGAADRPHWFLKRRA